MNFLVHLRLLKSWIESWGVCFEGSEIFAVALGFVTSGLCLPGQQFQAEVNVDQWI